MALANEMSSMSVMRHELPHLRIECSTPNSSQAYSIHRRRLAALIKLDACIGKLFVCV